jgi:hypothetical protein
VLLFTPPGRRRALAWAVVVSLGQSRFAVIGVRTEPASVKR